MTDLFQTHNPQPEALPYDDTLRLVSDEITGRLSGAPPVFNDLTSYLAETAGKHIRAQSVLACAQREDGLVSSDAVKTAAAIELVHLATLVHDDVIDNAKTRRGTMALHKKFGVKSAVLCGDYLLCLALRLASELTPREERKNLVDQTLPDYLISVLDGEMRQDSNSRNYALTEREYFQIIRGKTASLFEASFYAGFLHSDDSENLKETYQSAGQNIGLIFQLADDCADYETTERLARKPVLSDYKNGVVTLPLIYALRENKELADAIAGGIRPQGLRKYVVASGGIKYTREKISELYRLTYAALSNLPVILEKKNRLIKLLNKASGISTPG